MKIICEVPRILKCLAYWVTRLLIYLCYLIFSCSRVWVESMWIWTFSTSIRSRFKLVFLIPRNHTIIAVSVWQQKWNKILDFNLNLESSLMMDFESPRVPSQWRTEIKMLLLFFFYTIYLILKSTEKFSLKFLVILATL